MKKKIENLLQVSALVYSKIKETFYAGILGCELMGAVIDKLNQALGDYQIKYDFLIGKDTTKIDGYSKNLQAQPGDTIIFDLSIGKDGAWCDTCRTFFIGEPNLIKKQRYSMLLKSMETARQALKNGALAEQIYFAANSVFEENGLSLVHHAGHRIGTAPFLQPDFVAGNKTKLKKGMIVTLEPGYYGDFGMRIENAYYIGDKVYDLFSYLLPIEIENYILI